jgi:hypothetical protein
MSPENFGYVNYHFTPDKQLNTGLPTERFSPDGRGTHLSDD